MLSLDKLVEERTDDSLSMRLEQVERLTFSAVCIGRAFCESNIDASSRELIFETLASMNVTTLKVKWDSGQGPSLGMQRAVIVALRGLPKIESLELLNYELQPHHILDEFVLELQRRCIPNVTVRYPWSMEEVEAVIDLAPLDPLIPALVQSHGVTLSARICPLQEEAFQRLLTSPHVTSLFLDFDMPLELQQVLSDALGSSDCALQDFSLRTGSIADEEAAPFTEALATNGGLERLGVYLSECDLSLCVRFGRMLARTQSLQHFRMTADLSGLGGIAIGLGLRSNTTLRSLQMTQCELDDDFGALLVETLQCHAKLEQVNLSANALTSATARVLADALRSSRLLKLNLAYNLIDDEGASSIMEALAKNPHLTSLTLSENRFMTTGIWTALGDALRANSTLTHFTLHGPTIDDPDLDRLLDALKVNQSVKLFNIRPSRAPMIPNPLPKMRFDKITSVFEVNYHLEELLLHPVGVDQSQILRMYKTLNQRVHREKFRSETVSGDDLVEALCALKDEAASLDCIYYILTKCPSLLQRVRKHTHCKA